MLCLCVENELRDLFEQLITPDIDLKQRQLTKSLIRCAIESQSSIFWLERLEQLGYNLNEEFFVICPCNTSYRLFHGFSQAIESKLLEEVKWFEKRIDKSILYREFFDYNYETR